MVENKKTLAQLLEGKSEEELGEFFDENDLSEYEDEMPEVQFEVSKDIRKGPKPLYKPLTATDKSAVEVQLAIQTLVEKFDEAMHVNL